MPTFNTHRERSRWLRQLKRRLLSETGGACFFCGVRFSDLPPRSCTLDHVIPRSRGGPDEEWNLVLACYRDNKRKADRPIESCVCQLRRGAGLFAVHDAIRRGLVDLATLTNQSVLDTESTLTANGRLVDNANESK
jgi:5-methylcytosine-specific restriction enzyme A